jgi:hypothetical protein
VGRKKMSEIELLYMIPPELAGGSPLLDRRSGNASDASLTILRKGRT